MPDHVIERAFNVLKIICKDYELRNILSYIEYHFINSHIVLHTGDIVIKERGIPSGSGLTSLIGSICHIIIAKEMFYLLK